MINFHEVTGGNKQEHKPHWLQIPDHPYKMLIIGSSESGKTNTLLNLINCQLYTDKIHLYVEDPYKSTYQFLINKHENVGLEHFKISKVFVEYSRAWEISATVLKSTIQ